MPMTIRINEAWFSRDTCAIFPHRSPVSLSLVSVSLTNVASPGIPFWACAQDCFGAWLAVQDVSISQLTATLQNMYKANL